MAVIKGYVDDSHPNDLVWAIGGYVANHYSWADFERRWQEMLDRHGVPYFHMRELANPNGVYAKWHPPERFEPERKQFFRDITNVICDLHLRGFWSLARIKDVERFNNEAGLKLEPYSLAAYGCMLSLAREFQKELFELIFDHVEKVTSKLCIATEYLESDPYYKDGIGVVTALPLPKELTFRDVIPLQAADFFIWEIQKHHLKSNEWFEISDRPTDDDARFDHYEEWARGKFGFNMPIPRKSLEAIMRNAAPLSVPIVWDYDNLCQSHKLRGGVWA